MIKTFFFSFLAFFSIFQSLHSWWDTPHMIIMQIVREQLDSSTVEKIEEMLRYLESDFPESSTFLTSGCFADDLAARGFTAVKAWHGISIPFDPETLLSSEEKKRIENLINRHNIHDSIVQSVKVLKNPKAGAWEKSILLRFLFHCVGDIHQPLHCIELYNTQFPLGDDSGHLFSITGSSCWNLHALWDSMVEVIQERKQRPLSPDDENAIIEGARWIMQYYPPESLPQKDCMNIEEWSKESYQLAIDTAYCGIEPGSTPSEEYLRKGQKVAVRQVALASYRLANLLKEIFNAHDNT